MTYDKFPGVPPRGSLLELLFTLVYLEKKRAELLSTRALVQASMPEHRKAQDPVIEAFDKYCDVMFPFLERATESDKEKARERLKKFVAKRAKFSMQPIWKAQAQHAKRMATLKRFAVKPTIPGAPQPYKAPKGVRS
jgi:hypothetical protein